jgi:hypothetical protein
MLLAVSLPRLLARHVRTEAAQVPKVRFVSPVAVPTVRLTREAALCARLDAAALARARERRRRAGGDHEHHHVLRHLGRVGLCGEECLGGGAADPGEWKEPPMTTSRSEASTSPLPVCAGAGGRVLVSTQRSGGGGVPLPEELLNTEVEAVKVETIERCEASSGRATKGKSGASAMALAKALRRWLEHGHLNHRRGRLRPRCYTVTLTSKLGGEAELRIKLAKFISVFERRAPKGGALFALDRAPNTGRWHVHALVLLPPTFDAQKLVPWWTRCWPRKGRPARKGGQKVLAIDVEKLDMVLAHHLGRTRKGAPIPNLPPLAERIVACGTLARPWALVAQSKGVPNAPAPPKPKKKHSRTKKASTSPLPVRATPLLLDEGHCLWCSRQLALGGRKDTLKHAGCRRSASRAKVALARRFGSDARLEVERLESDEYMQRIKEAWAEEANRTRPERREAARARLLRAREDLMRWRQGGPLVALERLLCDIDGTKEPEHLRVETDVRIAPPIADISVEDAAHEMSELVAIMPLMLRAGTLQPTDELRETTIQLARELGLRVAPASKPDAMGAP